MHTNLLIDSIVRQTTVLLARLSTVAGIRAPLARIADQVFVELATEIESQGVSRKVAADMFGLALRSYQKKVQRITAAKDDESTTLWQGILDHLSEAGGATRKELFERFPQEDPASIGAVLSDLVASGLAYKTGSHDRTAYGVTPEADLQRLRDAQSHETASSMVWLYVYRHGETKLADLCARFSASNPEMNSLLDGLETQGRIERYQREEQAYVRSATFVVPVGSSEGWEAAVFDHYQAMANAIASKLSRGKLRSEQDDTVGGTTLSYDVYSGHPYEEKVLGLLAEVRHQVDTLWEEVASYNREHTLPTEGVKKVTFYAGQYVSREDDNGDTLPSRRPAEEPTE